MKRQEDNIEELMALLRAMKAAMDLQKMVNGKPVKGIKKDDMYGEFDEENEEEFDDEEFDEDDIDGVSVLDYMHQFSSKQLLMALIGSLCMSQIIDAENVAYCLQEISEE